MSEEWRVWAECQHHNAELWHTRDGRGTALHICRSHCPVRAQCKVWAHEHKQWDGQTVGGQWWVRRSGISYPTKTDVETDTRYCRPCRGDAVAVLAGDAT